MNYRLRKARKVGFIESYESSFEESVQKRIQKAKQQEKEETTSDILAEYLEFKFNKPKVQTVPLLNGIPFEEIRKLLRFTYTCENYESFLERVIVTPKYSQPFVPLQVSHEVQIV